MRIKDLFTVPTNQKVTERHLYRVLISSVCSILLCMASLAGTTWAYFTVSVENEGNVIQTAENPRYTLLVDGQAVESGGELANGEHTIDISHDSEADDLQKKSTLYVTFSVDEVTYGYIILGGEYPHSTSVKVCNVEPCVLTWTVSWFMPGNPDVNPLTDNTIQIIAEEPAEETTKDSEPEEESAEQAADSEESEQAEEESATATEQEEEVAEETMQNTEDTTETTENSETTVPSETDSDPTNESSDPTDTETTATETATEPQAAPAPEESDTDAAETPIEEETETEDTVTPSTETAADPGTNETEDTEEVPGGEEAAAETESTAEEPASTEVMG